MRELSAFLPQLEEKKSRRFSFILSIKNNMLAWFFIVILMVASISFALYLPIKIENNLLNQIEQANSLTVKNYGLIHNNLEKITDILVKSSVIDDITKNYVDSIRPFEDYFKQIDINQLKLEYEKALAVQNEQLQNAITDEEKSKVRRVKPNFIDVLKSTSIDLMIKARTEQAIIVPLTELLDTHLAYYEKAFSIFNNIPTDAKQDKEKASLIIAKKCVENAREFSKLLPQIKRFDIENYIYEPTKTKNRMGF